MPAGSLLLTNKSRIGFADRPVSEFAECFGDLSLFEETSPWLRLEGDHPGKQFHRWVMAELVRLVVEATRRRGWISAYSTKDEKLPSVSQPGDGLQRQAGDSGRPRSYSMR